MNACESDTFATCPNGHPVRRARAVTCMAEAGYYWCAKCESVPTYKTVSGRPPMGMYYGPALIEQTPRDTGVKGGGER